MHIKGLSGIIGTVLFVLGAVLVYCNLTKDSSEMERRLNSGVCEEDIISDFSVTKNDFPVNINTAKFSQLYHIDGISENVAKAIIAYRDENGYFSDIEQLIEVKGIGEKTMEKIRNQICV